MELEVDDVVETMHNCSESACCAVNSSSVSACFGDAQSWSLSACPFAENEKLKEKC